MKSLIEQHMDACEHYTGIGWGDDKRCKVGVVYADVAVEEPLPEPFQGYDGTMVTTRRRYPCHKGLGGEGVECPLRKFPTLEEAQAYEAGVAAHFREMNERAERGECWQCGTKMDRKVKVGRCYYAEPCGCRLGQGR